MPVQLSLTQLAVLTVTLMVMVASRPLWAYGPGLLNLAVVAGVPAVVAWAVRDWRPEGRDLIRAALGQVALRAAPRHGVRNGRRVRRPRRRPQELRMRAWMQTGPGVWL